MDSSVASLVDSFVASLVDSFVDAPADSPLASPGLADSCGFLRIRANQGGSWQSRGHEKGSPGSRRPGELVSCSEKWS